MSESTIQINGASSRLPDTGRLADVLTERGIDPTDARGVAVAVNERIVRKADWVDRRLEAGDSIEIVTARQGG